MSLIYWKVLSAEKATDRWTQASGQRRRRNLSRKVAMQGLQYVVAFIFPWIFGITVYVMKTYLETNLAEAIRLGSTTTILEIVNAVIWPLKGFFTFLAYMRPKRKDADGRRTTDSRGGRTSNSREPSRDSANGVTSEEGTETKRGGRLLQVVKMSFHSFVSKSKTSRKAMLGVSEASVPKSQVSIGSVPEGAMLAGTGNMLSSSLGNPASIPEESGEMGSGSLLFEDPRAPVSSGAYASGTGSLDSPFAAVQEESNENSSVEIVFTREDGDHCEDSYEDSMGGEDVSIGHLVTKGNDELVHC